MIRYGRLSQQVLRSGRLLQIIAALTLLTVVVHWWSYNPSSWRPGSEHKERLAFATLLLTSNSSSDTDVYFTSIRILSYQLLHSPLTRSIPVIPLLILTTPTVPTWQTAQLSTEGATIIPVPNLELEWMTPLAERWRDVMVKLRLFELVQYDRIQFLDADTFLLGPLDGVFEDLASYPQKTLNVEELKEDEAPLPETYTFSTLPEVTQKIHPYPPLTTSYFNAGFFLLSPSLLLFNYYLSLLHTPNKFDSTYPEQNLLNYAHREDGNMPYGKLSYWWNICLPNMGDLEGERGVRGVRSVHAKLWTEGSELQRTEPGLRALWEGVRGEMVRFWGGVGEG